MTLCGPWRPCSFIMNSYKSKSFSIISTRISFKHKWRQQEGQEIFTLAPLLHVDNVHRQMVPFTKLSILCCPYSFLLSAVGLDSLLIHSSARTLKYPTWGLLKLCKGLLTPLPHFHTSPLEFKKYNGIAEMFLFGSSSTPGDGFECFCGHCTHRKHGTVGVRSPSIGAFLFDLDDSRPILVVDNKYEKWLVF